MKLKAEVAELALTRMDRIASDIENGYKAWGMPEEIAKQMVQALDKTADDIEKSSFGDASFRFRQAEFLFGEQEAVRMFGFRPRKAQVIQRDQDETFMKTFDNPQAPIQTEADEPFMRAYGPPDQSSVVQHGKSTSGRPLAPGHGPFTSGT